MLSGQFIADLLPNEVVGHSIQLAVTAFGSVERQDWDVSAD